MVDNAAERPSLHWWWAGLAGLGALALTRWALRPRFHYSFTHRTVLLTGGSRGLGLLLARRLAAEGARLALVARDEAELERARYELAARGATVRIFPTDLTVEAARLTLVERVEAAMGPIDVLLHCAGIIQGGPLENLSAHDYAQAMQLHFEAPLLLMRQLVPAMKRRGAGLIINISSIGGRVAVPHLAAYSASKFALTGLSEAWAAELAGSGVTITTICPGLMRTGSPRHALVKGQHAREYQWFKLADSLPGFSLDADAAADQILAAARRGEPVVVLGWPARLLNALHGVLPATTVRLLGVVSRMLPEPTPDGEANPARPGAELESSATTNVLTHLTDQAAARNNEL